MTEIVEDRTKDRGGTKDTSAREDEMPQKTRSPRGVRPHLGLKFEDTHRLGRAYKHALPSVASPPDLRLPVLKPDLRVPVLRWQVLRPNLRSRLPVFSLQPSALNSDLTPPLLGPEDEDFGPGMTIGRSNLRCIIIHLITYSKPR